MTANTIGPYDPATTVGDVLRRAIARIELGWCQRAEARGISGLKCDPLLTGACKWCLIGSLACRVNEPRHGAVASVLVSLDTNNELLAATWNDYFGRTKDEVLAVLRKALAIAEEQ